MEISRLKSGRKIPVGISQCAMGDPVRYNGGHKLSKVCAELLSRCFEYVPLCPEVAIGMGVPRKPIHLLVEKASAPVDDVRVVGVGDPEVDVTQPLRDYADSVVPELERVRGYIFMQNSPSCGLYGVRRYLDNGHGFDSEGVGLFARRLQQHFPHLPMEEVGRLNDSELRENFLARVFVYDAWFRYVEGEDVETLRDEGEKVPSRMARIIDFYTAYKDLLMVYDEDATRDLECWLTGSRSMAENALTFAARGRIMAIFSKPFADDVTESRKHAIEVFANLKNP